MEQKPFVRPTVTMVLFYVLGYIVNMAMTSYRLESPTMDLLSGIGLCMVVYLLGIYLSHRISAAIGQTEISHESSARLTFWILGCFVYAFIGILNLNSLLGAILFLVVYFIAEFIFLKLCNL